MNNKTILYLGIALLVAVVLIIDLGAPLNAEQKVEDMVAYHRSGDGEGLIYDYNELFASAGECVGCHGFDPLGNASVDENGNDINLIDDWRSSMMANAAKDPFWKAKVNHEVLVYPQHKDAIEASCLDCHAPLGYFNAVHLGLDPYTMEDLEADSIAKDGVSCAACHQQIPDSVGRHISGELYYQEQNIYGPYTNPFGGPMESFVGFSPVYDEYTTKSEACTACHTLGTETIDFEGNITDNIFFEQATYHEWVNSSYNVDGKMGVQCQGCHMPAVYDDVIIAANLLFLPPRNPFYEHEFVGANSFMLQLLKDNLDTLHIGASSAQMDSSIMKTKRMLQERSLDLDIVQISRDDSILVEVTITNKAGHKFPSGYPSRLAFVELLGIDISSGDTLFASGLLDEDYHVINRNDDYEPHYDFINSEEQVQIYEMVMGDINHEVTTTLTQASEPIKDNRLPPLGFTTEHLSYDTTLIAGLSLIDPSFNKDENGVEGTGEDVIRYKFFSGDMDAEIQVTAKVYYMSVPARWLESMFAFSSDQIDHFQEMFAAADHSPVMVSADTLMSVVDGVVELADIPAIMVYPNPSLDGRIAIRSEDNKAFDQVEIYDAAGRRVEIISNLRHQYLTIDLPKSQGYYFVKITVGDNTVIEKILRL